MRWVRAGCVHSHLRRCGGIALAAVVVATYPECDSGSGKRTTRSRANSDKLGSCAKSASAGGLGCKEYRVEPFLKSNSLPVRLPSIGSGMPWGRACGRVGVLACWRGGERESGAVASAVA